MIAFDDPKITHGQERFSNGLFGQAHMKHGYTEYMSDVEHTAEDSKDTITPMLHLRPEDPLWGRRALRIAVRSTLLARIASPIDTGNSLT